MKSLDELGLWGNLPWGACISRDGHYCYVTDNDNLGDGDSRKHILASEIWRDNAVLMAAAPELYEALRGLLEIVCDDCKSSIMKDGKCVGCPRVVAARAALEKAGGAE